MKTVDVSPHLASAISLRFVPFRSHSPPAGSPGVSCYLLTSAGSVSTTVKRVSRQRSCCTFHSSFSFLRSEPLRREREKKKLPDILGSQPLNSSCPVVAGGSHEVLHTYQDSRNFFSFCSSPAHGPANAAGLHTAVRVIASTLFMK